MHQFRWVSEKGGNFLNLLQKERVPRKWGGGGGGGGVPLEKGGFGTFPGGNYEFINIRAFSRKYC